MTAPVPPGDGAARVWALRSGRRGDDAQVEALAGDAARDLGCGWRGIDLRHGPLRELPNAWLGPSLASLRPAARRDAGFAPPWPDLVIAAGRRHVPAARWMRARSGGRTRLVQLGRPRAPLDAFDLVAATPQYGLPEASNVAQIALPYGRAPSTAGPDSKSSEPCKSMNCSRKDDAFIDTDTKPGICP